MRREEAYTFLHEKEFIDGLGEHSVSSVLNTLSKAQLLAKYIAACTKRVNWGNLDKFEVIEYAQKVLSKKLRNEVLIG